MSELEDKLAREESARSEQAAELASSVSSGEAALSGLRSELDMLAAEKAALSE